jgi:Protein of unknown function (DUF2799)
MFFSRALFPLAMISALTACTGMSEQACLVSDWRTVGFEDGTLGRSVGTIGSYRDACSKHGVTPDLDSYRAGHSEGLQVYCRPSQGFDVGHRGATYQGVCPADLEAEFLAAYNSGRHLHELEYALREVDNLIASNYRAQENIKQELTAIAASMVSNETTAEERVLLVSRAADLGRTYGELSASIDALTHERVGHERNLREYQEILAFGA